MAEGVTEGTPKGAPAQADTATQVDGVRDDAQEAKALAQEKAKQKARALAKAIQRRSGWGKWIFLLVLLGAGGGGWWWWKYKYSAQSEAIRWETAKVGRGEITLTVSATGTLQPQATVSLGSEISGRVRAVHVEDNEQVTQGQVLAQLDTVDLENAAQQADIALKSAKADTQLAQATLDEVRAREARITKLVNGGAQPTSDLESVKAERRRASAQLTKARAQEELTEVRLSLAHANIVKAEIVSPIQGVVLKRNVEPGNTIAASLQSPELFLIAEDLRQMRLLVAVDEADVGLVAAGQPATFTVDAWPDRTFEATVGSVNLAANASENVVTYTATLQVDNAERLLRPGMTATATIIAERRLDVLRVPAAALRFTPRRAEDKPSLTLVQAPRRPGGGNQRSRSASNALWVLREGATEPERLSLKLGRSDGRFTEVLSGDIKEGDLVVIAQYDANDPAAANRPTRKDDKTSPDAKGSRDDKTSPDAKDSKDNPKTPDAKGDRGDRPARGPRSTPSAPDAIDAAPDAAGSTPDTPPDPTPTPAPTPTPTPTPTLKPPPTPKPAPRGAAGGAP
jgi:HlyD family secretion protein